jgi:hypothetical protein
MAFYPENKIPKTGAPVYNGNGEQYIISDPRYSYHDGLQNTDKIKKSSSDNIYDTTGGANARAKQIGCSGYHETLIDGIKYYMPCENVDSYDLRIEQLDSALNFTYIGNYRVLSWDKPFENVSLYKGWIIDASHSNSAEPVLDADDISIEFRYSIDGKTWSLWVNVGTALMGLTNEFSLIDEIVLDPSNKFYPEFRFTSVIKDANGSNIYDQGDVIDPSIVIVAFNLDLTYAAAQEIPINRPSIICSNEVSNRPVIFSDCNFTFNPYAVNKALNLYQDLSSMVNKIFGLDANYYSIQPQGRGKDVILKEYTLFDVVEEKCVKVMLNQNQFPDNKINFDPFGTNYQEPFEIQMDKLYFESIFGKGSQPRKRDIIYFPMTNRIYEINATYLFRDFMNAPVYFKMEIKKYTPKSNTYFKDPTLKEELDGIMITTRDLFGADVTDEELKITNPQQYATTINQMSQDPIRSYVYKNLANIGYDLNNNWTIVFNNYYDMSTSFNDDIDFIAEPHKYRTAIGYKVLPKLAASEELAYTAWFSIKDLYDNNQMLKRPFPIINMVLESYDSDFLYFDTTPKKHRLEKWLNYDSNPEGYVSISGDLTHTGGYHVIDIIDDYKFKVENLNIDFDNDLPIPWKMQKAQSRNLISGIMGGTGGTGGTEANIGTGFRIDIVHSGIIDENNNPFLGEGSLIIKLNDKIINSPLQFKPVLGDWYGLVVNFSNVYKQIAMNIWGMSYDPTSTGEQSSKLIKIHDDARLIKDPIIFNHTSSINRDNDSPFYGDDTNGYKIYTSPIYLTNIRLFKNMIDIDNQSAVLNQNIVRDSHLSHIIDNAKPLLSIPKFARNK